MGDGVVAAGVAEVAGVQLERELGHDRPDPELVDTANSGLWLLSAGSLARVATDLVSSMASA